MSANSRAIIELVRDQPDGTAPTPNSGAPVIPFPAAIDQRANAAEAYLASLSPGSRPTIEDALNTVARWLGAEDDGATTFPWHTLRYSHTANIRARLVDAVARAAELESNVRAAPDDDRPVYRPNTANKILAALRGALHHAWQLDQMTTEDFTRAIAIKSFKQTTATTGRAASSDEFQQLLDLAEKNPTLPVLRNVAAILIAYNLGLRVGELVALDLSDYNPRTHRVRIRSGKGGKAASLLLTPGYRPILAAYLHVRGTEPGPLFTPVSRRGAMLRDNQVRRAATSEPPTTRPSDTVPLARLGERGFTKILRRCCDAAGVADILKPHDLRRSMITHFLELTSDLPAAQRRARHAHPQTTMRYDRREQSQDDEMATKLDQTITTQRDLPLPCSAVKPPDSSVGI